MTIPPKTATIRTRSLAKISPWFLRLKSLAAALALMMTLPAAGQADIALTFGAYTADKPTATVLKYKPFLDFLAQRMSERLQEPVSIRMKVARTYADGIEQLATGVADFSRFGPASYVAVKGQNPGIQIVTMESKKGQKRFKGVIVVHQDSSYQSLSDLEGQSFAFGDALSTIGRYLAQAHLLEAGISSDNLSDFEFLGRHDLVGEAVGSGRFQAGALKESTFKKLVKKGVPIRVLFEFENVTKPWLAHPDIAPHVLDAMRQVMLASENEDIVRKIAKNGFLEGADADYDFVRDAMEKSLNF